MCVIEAFDANIEFSTNRRDTALELESEIVKCFKVLLNNRVCIAFIEPCVVLTAVYLHVIINL